MKRLLLITSVVAAMNIASLSSAATWPPGQLTKTATTKPYCFVGSQSWGQITYYTNWTYKDSSGVNHVFSGTSYFIQGSAANCPAQSSGGFTSTLPDGTGAITLVANGSTGTISITANLFPQYHILTLLYDPPGNKSSAGIMNTTFYGVTNSISTTWTDGNTITYSGGATLYGIGAEGSSSVSFTKGFGTANAFTNTITNGSSLTLNSSRNPVDHTNDVFWIWLNPQVTVTQSGANAATYSLAPPSGKVMDAVRVTVAGLKTPSKIDLAVLEPITINGVVYPGLSNICAHPLPASQCTQANACGCVPSDFTQILATDPIVSITQNTPPSQIDAKRYFALSPPPSPFPFLQYGTPVGFTVNDQNQAAQTQTEVTGYSTSYSTQAGASIKDTPIDFTLSWRTTDTFTWTQNVSLTNFSGTSHQMNLTLGTSTSGCDEAVDVYEDYLYHTFVSAPAATPPTPCDSN